MFCLEEPVLRYHQNISNSCCLSILASVFCRIGDNRAEISLENFIEESLTLQKNMFRNRIDFDNDIMKNELRHKGEQRLKYNLKIWGVKDAFNILNYIS